MNFDIYNLIRSEEIREYYRNNVLLSVEQQINIIVHSYKSLDEKTELLKELSNQVSGADKGKVNETLLEFERFKTLFYNPEKIYPDSRIFYVVERQVLRRNYMNIESPRDLFDQFTDWNEYCDNIKEVMDYINSYDDPTLLFYVNLIVFSGKEKHSVPAFFSVVSIDGKFEPYRCTVDDDWNCSMEHIDLPFEHGCRVKFRLPIMKEPYYGVLWSELDGNGCWYNFMYPEGTDVNAEVIRESCIDLSYPNIALTSDYSVLDWLERA